MTAKQRRFERVRQARQEHLELEQGALAQTLLTLTNAKAALETAITLAAKAREAKLVLRGAIPIDDWRAREAWRLELERRVNLLRTDIEIAENELILARKRVAEASVGVEQIDVILRRTRQEEAIIEARNDQRASDELSQRTQRR